MTATTGVQGKVSEVQECAGCNKKIHDKYVLKVGTSIPEPPVSLPAGHGPLLARGLPQVRLLWRQAGGGGPVSVHQGEPPALQERLPQVRTSGPTSQLPSTSLISGSSARRATARPARRSSRHSRWWWGPEPTSITWSASPARSAATGSVWGTSSSCTTTRCCVVLTTRRGWSSPPSHPTQPSWRPSSTRTTTDSTTTTTSYHLPVNNNFSSITHNPYLPSPVSGQLPHSCLSSRLKHLYLHVISYLTILYSINKLDICSYPDNESYIMKMLLWKYSVNYSHNLKWNTIWSLKFNLINKSQRAWLIKSVKLMN